MAISGNLQTGQQLDEATPKIKINGTELTGGLQQQDERLSYYRTPLQVNAPATLTITSTDGDVDIHYTFNGRTPTSKSPKYTGAITLRQNSTGDSTVIKARAFKSNNSNLVSKIVKATLNVLGGNTAELSPRVAFETSSSSSSSNSSSKSSESVGNVSSNSSSSSSSSRSSRSSASSASSNSSSKSSESVGNVSSNSSSSSSSRSSNSSSSSSSSQG